MPGWHPCICLLVNKIQFSVREKKGEDYYPTHCWNLLFEIIIGIIITSFLLFKMYYPIISPSNYS